MADQIASVESEPVSEPVESGSAEAGSVESGTVESPAEAEAQIPAEAPLSEDELREAFGAAEETVDASGGSPDLETAARAEPAKLPTGPGLGTGRRKEAVARVRLIPGDGRFLLNGRSLEEYFPARVHRMMVAGPLRTAGREKDFDVIALLHGGGISGQAGALRMGIARALLEVDISLRPALKAEGMLRRDAREKERRKYGLKKARKAPQYSKR